MAKKKPDLDALGAEYRAIRANAPDLQRAWAQAEVAWSATRTPRNPDGDDDLRAAVVAAAETVQFNRACLVAAGEAYKGQTFAEVTANNYKPNGGKS